jgi:hypothetical protein
MLRVATRDAELFAGTPRRDCCEDDLSAVMERVEMWETGTAGDPYALEETKRWSLWGYEQQQS